MGTFLFPLTSYPGNLPNILTSDLLQPNLQESRHVYGTCTSVELPGTGRTTPVDKRIVIRSDCYLIVRVIINIDVISEDRRNVKRVKSMQHRQLGTIKKTVDHSEGRAPMPRCPRIRVLPRIFLRYHAHLSYLYQLHVQLIPTEKCLGRGYHRKGDQRDPKPQGKEADVEH